MGGAQAGIWCCFKGASAHEEHESAAGASSAEQVPEASPPPPPATQAVVLRQNTPDAPADPSNTNVYEEASIMGLLWKVLQVSQVMLSVPFHAKHIWGHTGPSQHVQMLQ